MATTKMTKRAATMVAHTLSNPSKMPCKGYSLPASRCITGSKLRQQPGTVCSDCYACKGMYAFGTTQAALEKRFASLDHPDWVEAMVTLIGDDSYFRWHDSGDLQSVDHLLRIIQVAMLTPHCNHWLPTKELGMVSELLKGNSAVIPQNMIIRLSAPKVNSKMLTRPTHPCVKRCRSVTADFVVGEHTHTCPAPKQDGACQDCRACWNPNVEDVAYLMH